jgi:exodeoxyribonuclease VII small subunit
MGDTEYTFAQARTRLEDIVTEVRKKDLSLESSLDLLEEGVRLANSCTEQIDQSEWRSVSEEAQAEPESTQGDVAALDESVSNADAEGAESAAQQ